MKNSLNPPMIETNRLRLRKFSLNDLEAVFAIFSDEEVNLYLPWFTLKSFAEAKLFLEENYLKTSNQATGYHYAVCLKSDNLPIGYVNISDNDSHDLGYGLKKEYWNQGIVTEACQAVIKSVQKAGIIPYLTATHDINNLASGQVMKKIGMSYCYSYEEQWQPKNKLVTFRMYQLNLNGQNKEAYKKYWNNSTVHFIEPSL